MFSLDTRHSVEIDASLTNPCLATMTDANKLGREVPAAVTVSPIMSSLISRMQPHDSVTQFSEGTARDNTELLVILPALFIINSARKASQTTDIIIVTGYHFVNLGFRT